MIVAIGAAIIAALQWGLTAMPLLLELLEMAAAGVAMVLVIHSMFGPFRVEAV